MKKLVALCAVGLLSAGAQAAVVDLSTWTQEGSGTWNLQAGNNSVLQTVNGDPTIYYSDYSAFGNRLSGSITVQTTGDDDFIGFVIGFNPGDLTNANADYLLIDWKQANQNFFGLGAEGLAVSNITGPLGDNSGAWSHNPTNNVTELGRGANLGGTGWADNTTYTFDIEYDATKFKLSVDGVEEVSLSGNFNDGRFGFYNYSQANVLYAGITNTALPPPQPPQPPQSAVPEPASWAMMIGGLALVGGVMRHRQINVRVSMA